MKFSFASHFAVTVGVVAFFAASPPLSAQVAAQPTLPTYPKPVKKMIEFGFDIPNTKYLREHHEEMQRTTPFDGAIISLEAADTEGKTIKSWSIMDARPWKPEWFDTAVADLKACKFTTFTDNFIRLNFNPATIAWDNDAGWKTFCDKSALVAKISKETGMKGVEINYETYGRKVFKFDPDGPKTFDEMQFLARRRGREWMSGMVAEFPDMIFFALFFVELNLGAGLADDAEAALAKSQYGLVPAFFNGVLDVTPPTVRILDACEGGYYLNGKPAFTQRALAVLSRSGPAIRLIAPENREKYARQIEVGFGFYLDMYTNPEGHKYYRGPVEGGTRLDRLRENLEGAWAATDEYVWLYGERYFWWNTDDKRSAGFWEDALPGMTRTIRFVKDPVGEENRVFEELKTSGITENLVRNGDFSQSKPGRTWVDGNMADVTVPDQWSVWQAKVSRGTFSYDEADGGSARASNTEWGSFGQSHDVTPGEYYYAAIDCRQRGEGTASFQLRWQTPEGQWKYSSADRNVTLEAEPKRTDGRPIPEGWKRGAAVVRVPPGIGKLVLLAGVRDQKTKDDVVRFDNAVLVRLK